MRFVHGVALGLEDTLAFRSRRMPWSGELEESVRGHLRKRRLHDERANQAAPRPILINRDFVEQLTEAWIPVVLELARLDPLHEAAIGNRAPLPGGLSEDTQRLALGLLPLRIPHLAHRRDTTGPVRYRRGQRAAPTREDASDERQRRCRATGRRPHPLSRAGR